MVEFDADLDRPAVDDQIDAAFEIALHMRCICRRDMAGEIGRRRHHGAAERAQDRARDRMRGNADRDGLEPRGREFRDRATGSPRQHQGQRSRPERFGERKRGRIEAADRTGGGEIADMGDQRVESGPSLGLIEAGDGKGIGGVGAEPVDGLGRERDQPAIGERARGRRHRGLAGGQNRCGQAGLHGSNSLRRASCGAGKATL